MTYPPQPPGPYGQQPGPYGPQGPYHQGPRNQGPYPPQPPQTPWGAGDQGGFPVGPPPAKPRTGLITSLVIVAILVVGGGGVGAYLLLGKDDDTGSGGGGGDARSAAESYVGKLTTILNTDLQDIDLHPLQPLACAGDYEKLDEEIEDARDFSKSHSASPGDQPEVGLTMKDYEPTSDGATFTLTQTVEDDDGDSRKMTVAKEDGDWTVCGLYRDEDEDRPSPTADNGDDHDGDGDGDRPSTSRRLPPNPIPTTN
ncbi:MAG: hypothetical protein GEV28_02715 [Actinophytocola sp.]|uniref:Rv0361 family membrane protein n=1 Tax=Actinophytocola sp. TaxID=1872138 RepID=UPI001322BF67|nr:hypothetical protein [Actinophytocola sp.]MPZ79348.1 hypothetical protein [Actinophytocola sp.]